VTPIWNTEGLQSLLKKKEESKMVNGYSQAVIQSADAEALHYLDKRFIRNETISILAGDEGYAFCKSQLNHILEKIADKLKVSYEEIINRVTVTQKSINTYTIVLNKKGILKQNEI
jgi:predicted nuclease of restriction endonuclease-like RecB superfamily